MKTIDTMHLVLSRLYWNARDKFNRFVNKIYDHVCFPSYEWFGVHFLGWKYRLGEVVVRKGKNTVRRVVAVRDFGDVKKGDVGGCVQSYRNLSQKGDCWIYDEAVAEEQTRVYENAKLKGNANMWGWNYSNSDEPNTLLHGNAVIDGYVNFSGGEVSGNARVEGDFADDTWILYTQVEGDARVLPGSELRGCTILSDEIIIGKHYWRWEKEDQFEVA